MNSTAPSRRRVTAGLAGAISLAAVIVVITVLVTRTRQDAIATAAIDDDRVVATLQTAARNYPEDLRVLLRETRANPEDSAAAKRAARRLIDEGRVAGDSRLVGAAHGVLRPFLGAPDAEVLYLSATALQYQHDFPGALRLLDQAIALAPSDTDAILSRATINTVLGRFDIAQVDCRRLHTLLRPDLGLLCQAAALTLTAEAPAVYERLNSIVAQTGLLEPMLRYAVVGLMGEIAALQGWNDLARDHLGEVLAADPEATRLRIMLADVLLAENAADEALRLLEGAPEVDGVLLRLAMAADRLGNSATADPARAELERRFRQNLDLGLSAHAREETRYFLQVAPDPDVALSRARVNWDLQHEIEDAQLLIDAATVANAPGAAAPVLRWMAEQAVSVPTLAIPDAVREAAR
jgi:tetratricopeptide (TPR) repeat protein